MLYEVITIQQYFYHSCLSYEVRQLWQIIALKLLKSFRSCNSSVDNYCLKPINITANPEAIYFVSSFASIVQSSVLSNSKSQYVITSYSIHYTKLYEHYQDKISYLYTPEAKLIVNSHNIEAIQAISN